MLSDDIKIKFSSPGWEDGIVQVTREMPDGAIKPIGRMYMESDDESGSVLYICADNIGYAISPPVSDLAEAERIYKKHACRISEKERIEELLNSRQEKGRIGKSEELSR